MNHNPETQLSLFDPAPPVSVAASGELFRAEFYWDGNSAYLHKPRTMEQIKADCQERLDNIGTSGKGYLIVFPEIGTDIVSEGSFQMIGL